VSGSTPRPRADSSQVGTTLASKYRLDEELGRGGMGAVYRAFHLLVHKDFAVKVLNEELASHKKIAQRFFLEAQAAGRIGHPGILEVYDVGEDAAGRPFMVMELLRGEPLSAMLARGPLGVDEACWIAIEVLDVLAAAHGAGVVHRDVKPQNVFLVDVDGGKRSVKLLDFGIAKFMEHDGASAITRSGEIIGSPLYMAPEQAKGEAEIDARVDVWSVGAMLFEMLTGTAAHAAASPVAVLAKILTEPAPPPSSKREAVPREIDAIVTRALRIERAERFESARAMQRELRRVRAARGQGDVTPTFPPAPPRPAVRTGDDRVADVAASTSTVASARTPAHPPSNEPPMEAAVTNDADRAKARTRPLVIGAAVATLAGAAALPWLVPRWTESRIDATTASATAASSVAPATPSAAASAAVPAALTAPPAPPAPAAPTTLVAASASAAASASTAAPASAGPAPTPRATCRAGEVLSQGHCCPLGMIFRDGRCDRPLATSF
jgi:serine/threonine-protein kinase